MNVVDGDETVDNVDKRHWATPGANSHLNENARAVVDDVGEDVSYAAAAVDKLPETDK